MFFKNIFRCIKNCLSKMSITKPIELVAGGCKNQSCMWYQHFKDNRTSKRAIEDQTRESQEPIGNFVLNPAEVQFNRTYTVILKAQKSGQPEGFAEYTFVTDSPPTRGVCTVHPERGIAIKTEFKIACSGWLDEEMPLWYEFYSGIEKSSEEIILAYGISAIASGLYLPPGDESQNNVLQLFVKVFDASGAYHKVPLSAQVGIYKSA